jgi:Amt family ammonium transporter
MSPRRLTLCLVGDVMLWVGWYGFNSGSAAATQAVANAFTTTTLATLVAAFAWTMAEYSRSGKPSILGFCCGAVAGLAAITPASGLVSPNGAIIIGLSAGLIPLVSWSLRSWFGYGLGLETFGVHALGGMLGVFLTGVLASEQSYNAGIATAGPAARINTLARLVAEGGLWFEQVKAILITLLLAGVVSAILAWFLKAVIRLHPGDSIYLSALDASKDAERS